MGEKGDRGGWSRRLRAAVSRRVGIDVRALAALRIGLGGLLLLDLGLRARSLRAHYTDFGMLPRDALFEYYGTLGRLSVHALSGAAWVQVLLFVLAGGLAVALVLGYRTTTATVLSVLLLGSLHARNPLVLNAGDSLFRRLLMWSVFLPLGARWSIDSRRGRRVARNHVVSVASVALLSQIVLMYVVNGVLKLRGSVWPAGDAIRIVFGVDQLTVLFGDALAGQPVLLELLGHVWLAMTLTAPVLLVSKASGRTVLTAAFILAHCGMAVTLRLGIFPMVAVVGLLVFLPESVWDRVEDRVSGWEIHRRARQTAPSLPRVVPARQSPDERTPASSRSSVVRSSLATGLPAILLVLVVVWNAASLGYVAFPAQDAPVDPREHRWDMFAPQPLGTDVWYVVPGTLESGARVDAYDLGAVEWDRPPDTAETYPSARWRKSLMDLWRPQYADLRPSFGAYLCRRWNERHETDLESVAIYVVESPVRLNGSDPTRRKQLWRGACPTAGSG